MNKTLAIEAIVVVVALAQTDLDKFPEEDAAGSETLTQIQYRPGGGRHRMHGPSYLRNVTREARLEYFAILRNATLTIAQQKVKIFEWADRNGVAEHLTAYNVNETLMKEEMRRNVSQVMSELPYAVQRMQEVIDNEEQTYAQQRQALRNLTMENPILYRAAKFVNDLFSRRCCGGRGGPGPRGGPGSRGGPRPRGGPRGPGRQTDSSFTGYDEDMEEV